MRGTGEAIAEVSAALENLLAMIEPANRAAAIDMMMARVNVVMKKAEEGKKSEDKSRKKWSTRNLYVYSYVKV